MMDMSKFYETRTAIKQIAMKVKYYIFRRLFRKSQTMFMNPADIITRFTLAYDFHERVVYELFQYLGNSSYNDFFIDIGANIGLTSSQTKGLFKKYYMVEPNPILHNVLVANATIHLPEKSFNTYNVGLSDEEKNSTLMIPRDNWGGAFILDGNDYDINTLLSKDGKNHLDEKNYLKQNIKLIKSDEFINNVIQDLKKLNLENGVLKIDVEGYEKKILRKILPILQENKIGCYILFEQWNDNWDPEEFKEMLDGKVSLWLLEDKDPDIRTLKGLIQILKFLIFGNKISNKLIKKSSGVMVGNILMKLDY